MAHQARTSIIATHALRVGLAAVVPLPLLDDALEARAGRRMVRALAQAYELELPADAVVMLADGSPRSTSRRVAKTALLLPLKALLRKTFIVLTARSAVLKVSGWVERGVLLDWAFASGWCEPLGSHPAREVRAAIDEVLASTSSGPVEHAVRGLLAETTLATADLARWLRAGLTRTHSADDDAPPDLSDAPAELDSLSQRLARAVEAAEHAHFDRLRAGLTRRLERDPS